MSKNNCFKHVAKKCFRYFKKQETKKKGTKKRKRVCFLMCICNLILIYKRLLQFLKFVICKMLQFFFFRKFVSIVFVRLVFRNRQTVPFRLL